MMRVYATAFLDNTNVYTYLDSSNNCVHEILTFSAIQNIILELEKQTNTIYSTVTITLFIL